MKRVLTSLWLIVFGTYSIFWAPPWLFAAAVAALGLLCFREYSRLTAGQGLLAYPILGSAIGLVFLLVPQLRMEDALLLPIVCLAISMRVADLRTSLGSGGALCLGIFYIFGAWRAGIGLRALSTHWLFFAVALNWAGDVAAYYVGRAIGKRKLAPRVSPGKSVEGAIANLLAALLFGSLYLPHFVPGVTWLEAGGLALLGSVAGQFGDLSESALKRGAGMKDSGTMLAGHGGWLDRLDSSLFSMPAVYFFLQLLERLGIVMK